MNEQWPNVDFTRFENHIVIPWDFIEHHFGIIMERSDYEHQHHLAEEWVDRQYTMFVCSKCGGRDTDFPCCKADVLPCTHECDGVMYPLTVLRRPKQRLLETRQLYSDAYELCRQTDLMMTGVDPGPYTGDGLNIICL